MNEDSYQELARLREQVTKQEKLASLGMLTAGIAHEIQNPLNFVINFSKMSSKLMEDLEDIVSEVSGSLSEDDREELGEIISDLKSNITRIGENGERASSIIRNILLYSRGKEDEYLPTDLCRLTKEYVALSYHAMRANHKNFNVTFEEDYDETLPQVNVIPQDFSRAVLNIMNNACYAVFAKSRGATDCGYSPTISISLRRTGTTPVWSSRTTAPASQRISAGICSPPSSPPSLWERAQDWVCLSPSPSSSRSTAGR